MVALCAGCNIYEPWAGLVVGILAGCVYYGASKLMISCKLDDPLDAVAVHMGGGTLGVLAVPFFKQAEGILWMGHTTESWDLLGYNLAGLLAIIAWSGFWSTFIFGGLHYFNNLRVGEQTEIKGNDLVSIVLKTMPILKIFL